MKKPESVLVLGSGGLKIGQAGEFDYSGSQALKALKEEGVRTILINPNIATIQTSEGMADATYFLPVTPEFVKKVIEKERPDGILLAFGGQTALNCGIALYDEGILYKHGVEVLGTPVEAIRLTEDRELFAERLREIGVSTPRSRAAVTMEEAVDAARAIGYPVMVRAAFALGGAGSGLCANEKQLISRCGKAFSIAPQVLVEEWLGGWKEIEYEVVRDRYDNCITVCNMENFDPLGIHTGESIVIAPSQTLTDGEYHRLRSIAIEVIRSIGIVGECNIQYALDPRSEEYRIIEVNARLSRSSALASKATGYPLAYVAAKLSLGASLSEIPNKITRATMSCFEPALDYCVVKIPRWDLGKFKEVDTHLGSEMKSVGEVMSIGRNFEEAIQKAVRMTGIGAEGLSDDPKFLGIQYTSIKRALSEPTDRRIFAIYTAFREGWDVEAVHRLTKIDRWFLDRIAAIGRAESELEAAAGKARAVSLKRRLGRQLLLEAKRYGFSDAAIAKIFGVTESVLRSYRESLDIRPSVKQIDTLAAEYPAETNYLYLSYSGKEDDVLPSGSGVMVPGSGPYRIGSSVEFDWCCVNALQTARALGKKSIMLNCNPETVSTDYDVCDRLYFDELSLERVLDVYSFERPEGIILSMGGQIPNNLAMKLYDAGAVILGTSPSNIDRAEDRHKFSALLDELGIDQPAWSSLRTVEEAKAFAAQVGYPVLLRPSYVLSGAAMNVAWDESSLSAFLGQAAEVSPEYPVVVSKFMENAKEIEIDAVARRGEIVYNAITEHIENAGVHSGDATVVLPAQRLYIETIRKIRRTTERIADALEITGPFNIQFLAQNNRIKVIECNLRASRSFPFCSKVSRVNMIDLATRAILDAQLPEAPASALDLPWVGVKAAQFSFSRLHGADPILGVEMASTGEVGCIGSELDDAFLKALLSVGYRLPKGKVLLSTGPIEGKVEFLDSARKLHAMGYELNGSEGTARFLATNGIPCASLHWPLEKAEPNIASMLRGRQFDLVINIPKNNKARELKNDYLIRRLAVDFNIPLFTNIKVARQFIDALETQRQKGFEIKAWEEYR
ncbi:MAG TPA: carbamoyl-phosphate synthase (glutamine-hydrolyzing) large subunit [Rectinemataceae bacterium]